MTRPAPVASPNHVERLAQARADAHVRDCIACEIASARDGGLCPVGSRLATPPWRRNSNRWLPEPRRRKAPQ